MLHQRLQGLFAAVYTPLDENQRLQLSQIIPVVDHLKKGGVSGLYVCGTTGEGASLSTEERESVLEAYFAAAGGQLPVVVQVGHNCLMDSCRLAAHAQRLGINAISANAPSYFKCHDVDTLVDCMSMVASAAPELPFYYYHIPSMTGASLDMVAFLQRGSQKIPNLAGLKFSETNLANYQACLEFQQGRFDILWGCDEMLLGALATGARGAVGSTFNIAAPLYCRIIEAFRAGDGRLARSLQARSVAMVRAICHYPLHPAMKEVLKMLGFDFGPCRLPQKRLQPEQTAALRRELESLGFFEWAQADAPSGDSVVEPIGSPHYPPQLSSGDNSATKKA